MLYILTLSLFSRIFSLHEADPYLELRPLFELATKYCFDGLRERLKSVVRDAWPSSLKGWLKRHELFDEEVKMTVSKPKDYIKLHISEPASSLMLALEYDIPEIVPTIFMILSGIKIDAEWRSEDVLVSDLRWKARWSLLNSKALRTLQYGRERLQDFLPVVLSTFQSSVNCKSRLACSSVYPDLKLALYETASSLSIPSVLNILQCIHKNGPRDILLEKDGKDLCNNCSLSMSWMAKQVQEEIWRFLPEWFRITSCECTCTF